MAQRLEQPNANKITPDPPTTAQQTVADWNELERAKAAFEKQKINAIEEIRRQKRESDQKIKLMRKQVEKERDEIDDKLTEQRRESMNANFNDLLNRDILYAIKAEPTDFDEMKAMDEAHSFIDPLAKAADDIGRIYSYRDAKTIQSDLIKANNDMIKGRAMIENAKIVLTKHPEIEKVNNYVDAISTAISKKPTPVKAFTGTHGWSKIENIPAARDIAEQRYVYEIAPVRVQTELKRRWPGVEAPPTKRRR